MAGRKLEQAKKALRFCIENLNRNDRFEVIRFSTEVEPLFNDFVPATKANRTRADGFIENLKAMGGTAIDDALRTALSLRGNHQDDDLRPPQDGSGEATRRDPYNSPLRGERDRPFVLVFLTDGQPTIGTIDEDQIVSGVRKHNESRTRVFCFGIGTDVNTHLLDKIAEETRAFSQYVLPEEDLEVKVSSFFSKITDPVLANPVLKFTGGVRVKGLYPSPLPDLFKGEQLVVVGRYSGQGNAAVSIEGTVNGVTKSFAQDLKFSADASDSEFIPRLWATRRVGYLLDEIRLHGESAELRDEATELARKFGIVTPYTAYLIVEDETRRGVPVQAQSLQKFKDDSAARALANDNWNAFMNDRKGEQALGGARVGFALKSAEAPAAAVNSGSLAAYRALGVTSESLAAGPTPASASNVRLAQYTQQTRFVTGKNFFQNENQWVDAAVQKFQDAKRVRIQFNSTEYFELIRREPKALPWLALGQNVQFVLGRTVYEIYDVN
jgi:Ca-activated chloride channel family protein